jgi:hypothetical protein
MLDPARLLANTKPEVLLLTKCKAKDSKTEWADISLRAGNHFEGIFVSILISCTSCAPAIKLTGTAREFQRLISKNGSPVTHAHRALLSEAVQGSKLPQTLHAGYSLELLSKYNWLLLLTHASRPLLIIGDRRTDCPSTAHCALCPSQRQGTEKPSPAHLLLLQLHCAG